MIPFRISITKWYVAALFASLTLGSVVKAQEKTAEQPVVQELAVGAVAPDFELKNSKDELVKLSDFKGKKNVVLAFSRAHW